FDVDWSSDLCSSDLVCRVSYHPRLRSHLSSFRPELSHKQFHCLQDHEPSLTKCYSELLKLVYGGSESCEHSPSDQRSPCGSYHSDRKSVAEGKSLNL